MAKKNPGILPPGLNRRGDGKWLRIFAEVLRNVLKKRFDENHTRRAPRRPAHAVVDEDLAGYPEIWAAGGTPHTVFPMTFDELVALTGGIIVKVD